MIMVKYNILTLRDFLKEFKNLFQKVTIFYLNGHDVSDVYRIVIFYKTLTFEVTIFIFYNDVLKL